MSKHIIYINGTAIEVSEEIYTYIRRSDWNNEYAEIKRRREKITIDCETQTVKITPSKEDSLDRLTALGIEFHDQSEPLEEAIIRKITLEQALAQLTADERFIICELYFVGRTERELAKELGVSQVNIHKKKCKILYKLYEILK